MKAWARACVIALLASSAAASVDASQARLQAQDSGVDVRLRGISAVDAQVAWASGQKGHVLRTVDGGAHWQVIRVAGAEVLDFRDVEAFSADAAVVLSIGPGEASRIYRTDDGGASWALVLSNGDPRGFFDCMAFDGQRGWMLGDPVDGRYQVFATGNGGRDWIAIEGPPAAKDEAAFAASGTCIARLHGGLAVASGGALARIHLLRDGGQQWQAMDTGMGRRKAEAGVFSVVRSGAGWFAVGGDYRGEATPGNAAVGTRASSRPIIAPRGYRSGAACVDALPCIAVGPSGTDLWDGTRWHALGDVGFDAIDLHGNVGWLSGDGGRIARIVIGDE